MSKGNEQYSRSILPIGTSLHTDNDPLNQPKGTNRFVLNGVNESKEGKQQNLSNERASYNCTNRPTNFEFIGDKYMEDDTSVVILVNPTTGREEIGIIDKNDTYHTLVNTNVLGLSIEYQCQIVYRLRRGKERVIYWVDSFNKPRTFNLDRPYNFYNATYIAYLKAGGNPNTYVGEKWDGASFDLIKSYSSVPFFSNVEIIETGSILPGSYNFAIQYVDEDLNPTAWITTSNTVNIFNDSASNAYARIRGSRNVTSDSQTFPRANKSIKLTITNLDSSFPYYRVAIIRASDNTGVVDKVLVSDLQSTSESNFIYVGNDDNLAETKLTDVLIDSEVIFAPEHIEQLENRLLLFNTKGKNINWCEFQKYASKVKSDLTTLPVLLNNIVSEPNVKNAKSTFFFRGYMPGEAYSFGITYLFTDGTLSPNFHIPGKNILDVTSKMKYHEIDSRYLDIHNCSTNNYWGLDAQGETLVGKETRHHRFPFRKEVNKSLVSTTGTSNTVDKYRLTVTITLNPAWTPGPIEYPLDINGNPIVIPYGITYRVGTSPTNDTVNRQLVDTDIGIPITIYDDFTVLTDVVPTVYGSLDPASILATTYQLLGNERFILTFDYDSYTVSSSINNDASEIFGIEFSNIEKPHPDVVGFYITRNERGDDDRLIVDNALMGILLENQQYRAFGHIMPKKYYPVDNCGIFGDAGTQITFYDEALWFYNPEYQYFGKRFEFDAIEVEGVYSENRYSVPVLNNKPGTVCNWGGSKGLYIDDVQAGTSYDPTVNKKKNKDDDGFDLLIGFTNIDVSYTINNTLFFPTKKRAFYLNAASYLNIGAETFYNISVDNKIGIYLLNGTVDTEVFHKTATKKNSIVYGSLTKNNTSVYSNFITRPYYKEHNNPVLFGSDNVVNGVKIFNGDAMISAFTFVSTMFYDMVVADRPKKSQLWKIIVGVIIIIIGVIIAVYTGGAGLGISAAGAALLGGMAVAYGVSLLVSGIKFEQFKYMYEVDYEKGLQECMLEGKQFETIRWSLDRDDDTIRWFADRVNRIYMECSVPFGLRSGMTSGISDFIDSPENYDEAGFRTYLTEKLTTIDRDQGSGRLYRGIPTAEIYDMNLDYMRFNKEKRFIHLPIEYDCCADDNEVYQNRVWYSEQSFQEEKIDNYKVFLPNNYRDIEGEHGEITNAYRLGNSLFIHTKEGLWQLPQNLQERATSEIISFIGTGDFFNIPPRKVIDDTLGSGGSQHKWATVKTKHGVMFVNEIENKVYLHAEKVEDVSIKGMRAWFENNLKSFLSRQLFALINVDYKHDNNPANSFGIGYLSTYDTRYERVLITKKDYLIVASKALVLGVTNSVPIGGNLFQYCTINGNFYQGARIIPLTDTDYFENKSWTISYSFHNNPKWPWVSWHSYFPNYYIHGQNNLYSSEVGDIRVWKHNMDNKYQTYYGRFYPFIVEVVKQSEGASDETLEDITLQTRALRYDTLLKEYVDEHFITFNKVLVYNTRQSSGELTIDVKQTKSNPENWYVQQTVNTPGRIVATKVESNWNMNDFRDNVVDYSEPLFTTAWDNIKNNYFIDKVPNSSIITFSKPWYELENFRDKYIVIRLKFDNFDNINLMANYSIITEQNSNR